MMGDFIWVSGVGHSTMVWEEWTLGAWSWEDRTGEEGTMSLPWSFHRG